MAANSVDSVFDMSDTEAAPIDSSGSCVKALVCEEDIVQNFNRTLPTDDSTGHNSKVICTSHVTKLLVPVHMMRTDQAPCSSTLHKKSTD